MGGKKSDQKQNKWIDRQKGREGEYRDNVKGEGPRVTDTLPPPQPKPNEKGNSDESE